jgi:hypothetical protein
VCELLCDVSSLLACVNDNDHSLHVSFLFVLLSSNFHINCLEIVDVSIVIWYILYNISFSLFIFSVFIGYDYFLFSRLWCVCVRVRACARAHWGDMNHQEQ